MKHLDVLSNPKHLVAKSTLLGGLMTLGCLVLATFLVVNEYQNFQKVEVNKIMYLDSKTIKEKIRVWLKIKLFNAPCSLLSLDIMDSLQHHRVNLPVDKYKINKDGGKT